MVFGGLEKITLIDYPGKVASMVYTIGCNFRCPFCHNPELVNETVETRYSEEEILKFLESRKGMVDALVITGGEPTIHDDLLPFLKKVKDLGFLIKLDSNGTNPEALKEAIEKKLVDYIAMDIKSPMRNYARTVAMPVDTDAIRQSIGILMSSSVPYEFRTTLIKSLTSPEDIEEIGKEIKGAKAYYLQKFVSTKILNPQFKRKTTYTDEELKDLQAKMLKYVKYCGIR
jgi:pyruvate formate lyase activating enzyme